MGFSKKNAQKKTHTHKKKNKKTKKNTSYIQLHSILVSLGGLGVTCSPRDPRFAGSNLAEVDGFYSERKNPKQHKSSGRDFKLGVPILRFQAH